MLPMTLRQMEVFTAVVRHGSTVAAAGALGLSQSATSAALQQLERVLGTTLFERQGRALVLNAAGRTLLPQARNLLEPRSALLIGAGSAICGAAAVLATAPVAQARERDVGVAVATVVVFGTLSMFLYPWLAGVLWPATAHSSPGYGVYVGATVHEVAQVVVAASAIGGQAAHTAVITKMLRVLLLAPFLLILSWWLGRGAPADGGRGRITIPWFALGFVAVVLLHPGLPQPLVRLGVLLDQGLLTMAMLALGMGIQWQALRCAGIRPLWLAGALWLWLLGAGAVLTRWGWPG